MRTSKSVARKMAASQRRAQVVEWKTQGLTLTEIGRRMGGISAQRVHQILQEALREVPATKVQEYRELALQQNDLAIRELLKIATNEQVNEKGNPLASLRTRVEAWNAIRGFWERGDKIVGIYAPVRKELKVISQETIDAEIEKLNEQIAALDAQQGAG